MFEFMFDMDGVLCDWQSSFERCVPHVAYSDYPLLSKEERKEIKTLIANHPDFYERMGVLEHACDVLDWLVENGYKVSILSACGKINSLSIALQKSLWLADNILCPGKVDRKFVYTSKDKAQFAHENVVLIDDRLKAIEPFAEAGGKVVHYEHGVTNLMEVLKPYL